MIHKLHCQQNKPEISNKFYLGTVELEDQRCTYPSQTTAIFNSTISLSGIWVLIFKNYTWFRMYAERSFHQDQSQLSTSTPLGNIRKLRLSNHILCWISIFSTTFLPVNFVCILLCQFSPNKFFSFLRAHMPPPDTWFGLLEPAMYISQRRICVVCCIAYQEISMVDGKVIQPVMQLFFT